MKKAIVVVMVLLMAVPAFALPYCTTGCGMGQAKGMSCCCSKPALADGAAALTGSPCCPPASSALRGSDRPVGVPVVPSEILPEGRVLRIAAALPAARFATTAMPSASQFEFERARPPAEPLFLRNSVFRI